MYKMRMTPFDMAILNGTVIDPVTGEKQTDVGIADGKISAIRKIDPSEAKVAVNASGCLVTPGLIDYHCHVNYGGDWASLPAEVYGPQNGVTTLVDAGSAGCGGYELFHRGTIVQNLMNIKAYIFIGSAGQVGLGGIEDEDPDKINEDEICRLCRQYPNEIVGIKLKIDRDHCSEFGLEPLKAAVELGEKTGLRVSVHATDPAVPVKDVLDALRPGDIFCHMYHDWGEGILSEDGTIKPEVLEARRRGVLFDAAHGKTKNFSLNVAQKAIQQGFLPDIISSDYTRISLNARYPFTLMLTEYLHLGMSFRDVLERCTTSPHQLLTGQREELLAEGMPADVAVFRLDDTPSVLWDVYGGRMHSSQTLRAVMTIKEGMLVFDQMQDKYGT